jgi:hypothetical protein
MFGPELLSSPNFSLFGAFRVFRVAEPLRDCYAVSHYCWISLKPPSAIYCSNSAIFF